MLERPINANLVLVRFFSICYHTLIKLPVHTFKKKNVLNAIQRLFYSKCVRNTEEVSNYKINSKIKIQRRIKKN